MSSTKASTRREDAGDGMAMHLVSGVDETRSGSGELDDFYQAPAQTATAAALVPAAPTPYIAGAPWRPGETIAPSTRGANSGPTGGEPTMSETEFGADQHAPKQWRPLEARDRRVLGVLVEKSKTTPEAYPLSLNALRTGCN